MITFSFTALVLALFAGGVALLYRYAKREFGEVIRDVSRLIASERKTVRKKFKAVERRGAELETMIKQVASQQSNGNATELPAAASLLSKTEERFLKNPKEFSVVPSQPIASVQR